MATIKDIAERLGISISTVSKGLNGASDISDSLRQQVLDTAVEMGYTTKRSRKEEHRKLCLLIENMEYLSPGKFGYEIVLGFKQNAFRHKWDVSIVPVTPELQRAEKYDTYMLKNGYSGGFLVGFALQDEWMQQLYTTNVPTVLLDNFIPENPNICCVGTDNYEGIAMAVRHLFRLGHKNIAFLNGSLFSLVSDERQEAFENAMAEVGLPAQGRLMGRGYFVPETAMYHVPGFLKSGATAILCGNDLIAQGVIDECQKYGYEVPRDISVVGFDDLPIASQLTPPLTTIRQERNELGRLAYVALNSLVHHIPISKTLMRPQLIVRNSTARVPATNSGRLRVSGSMKASGDMKAFNDTKSSTDMKSSADIAPAGQKEF